MKKSLLLSFIAALFISCSIEDEHLVHHREINSLNAEFAVANECDSLNEDVHVELCAAEISNPTERGFTSYFIAQVQLHTDLPLTGSFEPTPSELLNHFNENDGMGIFASNYTVETENCGIVTVEVSVEVKDCTIPEPCSLFTEDQYSRTYSETQLLDLIDNDILNLKQVYLDLFGFEAPEKGNFDDSKLVELYNYYRVEKKSGSTSIDLTYNYTTTIDGCTDSALLTLTVCLENCPVSEPPCSLFSQENYSRVYTEAELLQLINGDIMNLKPLWIDLLEDEAPVNGGFEDSKITALYNYYRAEKRAGSTSIDLTYNYTAQVGDCVDSAALTLTVCLKNCPIAEPVCDLLPQDSYSGTYTEAEVLNIIDGNAMNLKGLWLGLLEEAAPKNGVFKDSKIIELYNYYRAQKKLGQTSISLTYPYSVKEGECMDSADLTLVINQ